ncbi:glycoside hydrolase family protein, partial [Streptomyces calidiresistens]
AGARPGAVGARLLMASGLFVAAEFALVAGPARSYTARGMAPREVARLLGGQPDLTGVQRGQIGVVAHFLRGAKGVAAWPFDGSGTALRESGSAWYYTWATTPLGIDAPPGVEFVPMIWGADFVTPQALAEARAAGPYLLGFNEPDLGEQANMGVEEALDLWPHLEATGNILGSPAVAYGGDTPDGWLDRFMRGAEARGLRVDFIALHWYGSDFRTEAAVEHLRSYLTAVHERYGKPIWLTEYALIDFSHGTRYPSEAEQAAFVTASTRMLESLPFLERYAWFGLGTEEEGPGTALFRSGGVPTDKGLAFRDAP